MTAVHLLLAYCVIGAYYTCHVAEALGGAVFVVWADIGRLIDYLWHEWPYRWPARIAAGWAIVGALGLG